MTVTGYGQIFFPSQLEDDIIRVLAPDPARAELVDRTGLGVTGGLNFLEALVHEAERQLDLDEGDIALPRAWNEVSAEDDWPIDRLPAIVVMFTGAPSAPERDEEGVYAEHVTVQAAAVCSAHTYREARRAAGHLGMAMRAAIAQNLAGNSDWVAGCLAGRHAPRPLPLRSPERTDTLAAYQVEFDIVICDSLSDTVSVIAPPADPTAEAPDDPVVDEGAVLVTATRIS